MEQNKNLWFNIIIVIVYIVGLILLAQLFNLHILQGNSYRETSNTRLTCVFFVFFVKGVFFDSFVNRESSVETKRGGITDSSGNRLVTTETGFCLELYKTKIDNDTLNKVIYNLVILLEKNKDTYNDNLPISIEPYKFKQDDEETQKAWKKEYGIDENATAEEAFETLKEKYGINEENIQKARKIMTVRYEISRNGYSNIKPVIISKSNS